ENVQSGLGNDQSWEKKAAKFDVTFAQGCEERLHDSDGEFILTIGIPIIGRTNRAHPPCVRTAISIKCPLMIAGRPEHPKRLSAHQRVHGAFAPLETFFDYDAVTGIADHLFVLYC